MLPELKHELMSKKPFIKERSISGESYDEDETDIHNFVPALKRFEKQNTMKTKTPLQMKAENFYSMRSQNTSASIGILT
jgi:hypothetical protein